MKIYILLVLISCVSNEASSNKSDKINKTMRDKNSVKLPSDQEILENIKVLLDESAGAKKLLSQKIVLLKLENQKNNFDSFQKLYEKYKDLHLNLDTYRRNLNELISIKTKHPSLIEVLMDDFQKTYQNDYKELNDKSIELRELKKSFD